VIWLFYTGVQVLVLPVLVVTCNTRNSGDQKRSVQLYVLLTSTGNLLEIGIMVSLLEVRVRGILLGVGIWAMSHRQYTPGVQGVCTRDEKSPHC
jgi:hypothetical protein